MAWCWDDAAIFLAVAEAGSTLGAARALGINQTTAARRIGALERALGLRLFDRLPQGYALSPEGAALLPAARELAGAAAAFEARASATRSAGLPVIRITTNEGFGDLVVAPATAAFRATHPGVRIDLDVSGRLLDLAAGEADVALRSGAAAEATPGVIQRRLPGVAWAVYCGTGYHPAAGRPRSTAECAGHPFASLGGTPLAMLRATLPGVDVVDVTNSPGALLATLRANYCLAALPCLMADGAAGIARCFGLPGDSTPTWLLYAERLKGRPEARAFLERLVATMETLRPVLAGQGDQAAGASSSGSTSTDTSSLAAPDPSITPSIGAISA